MNSLFNLKYSLGRLGMRLWEDMNARVKLFIRLVIVTLGVYLGLRYILPLVLPFIFAYLLAWIIRPIADFLYRKIKIPRTIGGSVSLLALVFLLGLGLYYLGKLLIKQALSFARSIPAYLSILAGKLDSICGSCDDIFGLAAGSARRAMDDNIMKMVDKVKTDVIPGMTSRTLGLTVKIFALVGVILIIIISAILIIKEAPELKRKYESSVLYKDVSTVTARLADAGIAYMRAQLLIMILVAVCCVTGFVIIRNEYALLLGIFIAILDALPIIGSGMVLIPWSVAMLLKGNIFAAAVLITVYLLCQIIREVAEPKLIGNRIGIRPLYTLISMYVGLKLFGVAGFILGPVGLIIIITILKGLCENRDSGTNEGNGSYTLDKAGKLE